MIENNLVSVPYYEFQAPDSLMNKLIEIVNNINFIKSEFNKVSETSLNIPDLENWINQCLHDVQIKVFPKLTSKLKITGMWANKSSKMQYHHKHSHANSIVSGILYLTDSIKGGNTIFYMKDPWYQIHNDGHILLDPNGNSTIEIQSNIQPKYGKLIIFPSTIQHNVTPIIDNSIRYTIAFNTFLDGNIGNSRNATMLHLKNITENL